MRAWGQKLVKFCTHTLTDTHTHTTAAKLVVRMESLEILCHVIFVTKCLMLNFILTPLTGQDNICHQMFDTDDVVFVCVYTSD